MFWDEDANIALSQQLTPFFHIHPAVRLLLGMVVGVAFSFTSAWSVLEFNLAIAFFSIAAFCLAFFSKKNPPFRAPAYWMGAIVCGIFVAFNAEETAFRTPKAMLPEMEGTLNGQIETIFRQDSASMRCIVAGVADPQPMPSMSQVRILLTITRLTHREQHLSVGSRIAATVRYRIPQSIKLPNEFDESLYCRSLGVLFTARAFGGNVSIIGQENAFRVFSHQAANAVSSAISHLFSPDAVPLMKALLLGDKTSVPPNVRQNFSVTGTAHVIAVSGLHVGVLIAILWLPIAFIPNRWLRLIVMLVAVTAFVVITGLQPSAIRASLMAAVMLTARAFERRSTLLNSVCFAAVAMLLTDASLLFSAGFQMSFAAVAGMGIFLQPFRRFFRDVLQMKHKVLAFIADSLAVTFAASSITSILVAVWFGIFSVVSPLANLAVVPLMSSAMVFGVISLSFYPISLGIASLFAASAQFCLECSVWINDYLANFDGAAITSSGAVATAVIATIITAYIFTSQSLRMAVFRSAVCTILVLLCSPFFFTANSHDGNLIFARRDMAVLSIVTSTNKKYIILADRKPHQKPRTDYGLVNYLASLPDPSTIVYRGNIAEWNAVQARHLRPLTMLRMTESVRIAADSIAGFPLVQAQYNN